MVNKLAISLFFVYSVTLLVLFVYSFSQIDLNLTLFQNPLYQTYQQHLIYLGYFNRPLSAVIFAVTILSLFTLYYFVIKAFIKGAISLRFIIVMILLTIVILYGSYPAFSHDIFNYMFDARIVTKYNANPYFAKALDYPADLWIRFMHWTHRLYPYGPTWLLITLPPSILGLGKFVLTLALFKGMFVFFHLGNVYLIREISLKLIPRQALVNSVFYALNPLIIIESLVSPHNEVVMLFFLLLSIYFMSDKKKIFASFLSLLFSIGIKYATITVLPIYCYIYFKKDFKLNISIIKYIFLLIALSILIEIYAKEAYPWYLIMLLGIGSLLSHIRVIKVILFTVSIGGLFRYLPFILYGSYSPFVIISQTVVFILPLVLGCLILFYEKISK